uniref:Uncharacterized protein n=1 Tax=Oryza rufipogon TaxID=4529 RepID=A0A0E0QT69_ORYRU
MSHEKRSVTTCNLRQYATKSSADQHSQATTNPRSNKVVSCQVFNHPLDLFVKTTNNRAPCPGEKKGPGPLAYKNYGTPQSSLWQRKDARFL